MSLYAVTRCNVFSSSNNRFPRFISPVRVDTERRSDHRVSSRKERTDDAIKMFLRDHAMLRRRVYRERCNCAFCPISFLESVRGFSSDFNRTWTGGKRFKYCEAPANTRQAKVKARGRAVWERVAECGRQQLCQTRERSDPVS